MKDKIKEINIREVTNGYIVHIGCCVFVFKQGELLEELTEYIREPLKTERKYMKEFEIRDDFVAPGGVGGVVLEEPRTASQAIRLGKSSTSP